VKSSAEVLLLLLLQCGCQSSTWPFGGATGSTSSKLQYILHPDILQYILRPSCCCCCCCCRQ